MRDNHGTALRMALVRPVTHSDFQRSAGFGFSGAITTPRHYGFLKPQKD